MEKYKIISTNAKGRSLVAQTQIASDETILTESPLVSAQFSWNKEYGYLACEHCMFPLETAEENIRRLSFDPTIRLPHPESDPTGNVQLEVVQCEKCESKFCSQECLKKAEIYHKIMCASSRPFAEINEIWKKMHYPPETASVLLVLRIFAMIKTNPEYLATFNEFCSNSVNEDLSVCHKILGEKFTSQLNQLQSAFVHTFADDEILSQFLTLAGLTRVFSMIGTNSQGIGTSSFAGWVKNVSELETIDEKQKNELDELIDTFYAALEETVGQFLNNEGSGLYVLQSKLITAVLQTLKSAFHGQIPFLKSSPCVTLALTKKYVSATSTSASLHGRATQDKSICKKIICLYVTVKSVNRKLSSPMLRATKMTKKWKVK